METRTLGLIGPFASQYLSEAVRSARPSTFNKAHKPSISVSVCVCASVYMFQHTVAVPLPYSSNKTNDFSVLSRRAVATYEYEN